MVRNLDELRAEEKKYGDYQRMIRLGRGIEMVRFRFREGVYGFGWLNEKAPEDMPGGIENEFYQFLSEKAHKLGQRIREAESALEALDLAQEES